MGEDQEKESTGAGWMVGAVIAAILGAVLLLCVACARQDEPIEPDTDAPAETQPAPQAAPTLGGVAQDAAAKISAAAAPGIAAAQEAASNAVEAVRAASPALSAALGPALESAKAQLSEAAAELGPALEALKAQAQKAADDAAAQIEALKSPSPAPSSTDE